jgi:hypothetical protein
MSAEDIRKIITLLENATDNTDMMSSREHANIMAVNQSYKAIADITDPSEAVQLAAAKKSGEVLPILFRMGINPSEAVRIAAVTKTGYALRHLAKKNPKPSPEVQWAAIKSYPGSISFLTNLDPKVKVKALTEFPWLLSNLMAKDITDEDQMMAFEKFPRVIAFAKFMSVPVCKEVIEQAKESPDDMVRAYGIYLSDPDDPEAQRQALELEFTIIADIRARNGS